MSVRVHRSWHKGDSENLLRAMAILVLIIQVVVAMWLIILGTSDSHDRSTQSERVNRTPGQMERVQPANDNDYDEQAPVEPDAQIAVA